MVADFAGDHIANHDALCVSFDEDDVEHLGSWIHLYLAKADLPVERGIGAKQQLLAGLPARIKGAAHLCSAERAVGQQAAVLTGERHSLSSALVDDVDADLREPVHIGLTRAVVAALYGVIK